MILQYVSEWDSPAIAEDFFRFYAQALRKKWKKMEVTGESEGMLSGLGDDGYFVVRRSEGLVWSVEGLASPEHAVSSVAR